MSKISVITGINRREVTRLAHGDEVEEGQSNLMAKVIGRWQSKRYKDARGRTKALGCDGKQSEFAQLVESVSRDLNPYTVLFELERTGCVTRSGSKLKLTSKHYIPKGKVLDGYLLLSEDLDNLIEGVEQNILQYGEGTNLHLRTFYDNISPADKAVIEKWILAEGDLFHQRARKFISQFDRDGHDAAAASESIYVAVGSFSLIKPFKRRDN